ncbi:MAG: DUF2950 family protein [Deltaproteobacteria bacterium]|nr:DUF2950 family protein [Deltaproteobacteria bacterium]
MSAIQVCLAYVDAQREYALKDRDADGLLQYAQKFRSDKGMKNGLYWDVKEGEEQSPLGPFIAAAQEEGYSGKLKGNKPVPYHGYYYRILKGQGKNAPGGSLRLHGEGRNDRRLCLGGLSCQVRIFRHHDLYCESRRSGL